MNREEFLESESARLKSQWDAGNYPALLEALRLYCWNNHALPDWVASIVIAQADEIWMRGSVDKGRLGSWQARYRQNWINKKRADLVDWHLKARERRGRLHVSALGRLYGYGTPAPQFGGVNIVTRKDVFAFVHEHLKGTPAGGKSPGAVADSYKNRGRPKRKRKAQKGLPKPNLYPYAGKPKRKRGGK